MSAVDLKAWAQLDADGLAAAIAAKWTLDPIGTAVASMAVRVYDGWLAADRTLRAALTDADGVAPGQRRALFETIEKLQAQALRQRESFEAMFSRLLSLVPRPAVDPEGRDGVWVSRAERDQARAEFHAKMDKLARRFEEERARIVASGRPVCEACHVAVATGTPRFRVPPLGPMVPRAAVMGPVPAPDETVAPLAPAPPPVNPPTDVESDPEPEAEAEETLAPAPAIETSGIGRHRHVPSLFF
jgi:hypothetical protein